MNIRRIGIVTAGRNDFGIYLPVLRALREHPGLEPVVFATGTHMDPGFGETVRDIEAAEFAVDYSIPAVPEKDNAQAVAQIMGHITAGIADALAAANLDMLMVLGDRFEMFAAASAAVPFTLPLVHLHGGERTEGVIDEQFRHAISKLSHLHFCSTDIYRNRLIQMGEEPWRVVVSGAPALDHFSDFKPWSLERLSESLDLQLNTPPLLVTYHPATLHADEQLEEVLSALEKYPELPVVITYPNSDPGYQSIVAKLEEFSSKHPHVALSRSLGSERYFSVMHHAAAMVGNSSSGIIEAASFELPVVNIGDRQAGRIRGANVIDTPCTCEAIADAILLALSDDFKQGIQGMINPYGAGNAAERIAETLAEVSLDRRLLRKRFEDHSANLMSNNEKEESQQTCVE